MDIYQDIYIYIILAGTLRCVKVGTKHGLNNKTVRTTSFKYNVFKMF